MKLKLTVITLIIFVCAAGTLRAQSGRRQSDKGSNSTSGKTQTPSGPASNPAEEEGMINQDTYQGETIEGDVLKVNTNKSELVDDVSSIAMGNVHIVAYVRATA